MSRYWLTPPDIYQALDNEFHFNFDPCPCPRPDNYNSLALPWGKCNYVNPPFNRVDSPFGGPTAFLRKAIQEQQQGNTSVLLLPVRHYMNIALQSGAELRSMGRVRWLDVDTKEPWRSPHPVAAFIFRGEDALLKSGAELNSAQQRQPCQTVPISEPMIAPQEIAEAVEHPTTTQGPKPCANCVSNSNSQTGFDRCQYCIHSELHHDNFEPRTASPVA